MHLTHDLLGHSTGFGKAGVPGLSSQVEMCSPPMHSAYCQCGAYARVDAAPRGHLVARLGFVSEPDREADELSESASDVTPDYAVGPDPEAHPCR